MISIVLLVIASAACAGPRRRGITYCAREAPGGVCAHWELGLAP